MSADKRNGGKYQPQNVGQDRGGINQRYMKGARPCPRLPLSATHNARFSERATDSAERSAGFRFKPPHPYGPEIASPSGTRDGVGGGVGLRQFFKR